MDGAAEAPRQRAHDDATGDDATADDHDAAAEAEHVTRAGRVLAAVALLTALAPAARATDRAVCPADGVLPAGRYFRTAGDYVAGLPPTRDCPRAGAAVVLGIFADGKAAQARIRELPAGVLTPGYPWALHTDELGPVAPHPDGIAVVAGLFASAETATHWLAGAGAALHGATVLTLADDHQALAAVPAGGGSRVVQLDAAGPVNAYRQTDAVALLSHDWQGDRLPPKIVHRMAELAPACTVGADDIFVSKQSSEPAELNTLWWEPVTCGDGTTAYVLREQTRVASVVWRDRSGGYRLSQVRYVECDTAGSYFEWRYLGPGRRSAPRLVASHHRCG